jgi:hypothetical protein
MHNTLLQDSMPRIVAMHDGHCARRESISATVRKCITTLKFYSFKFKRSDAVPLKQQMANEKQRCRFTALVQNGDRGR